VARGAEARAGGCASAGGYVRLRRGAAARLGGRPHGLTAPRLDSSGHMLDKVRSPSSSELNGRLLFAE
jgi:hypothetical protein